MRSTLIAKVSFTAVKLTGGMWKRLMDTNRERTLPAQYEQCRTTGRLDALKLKWKKGCEQPHIFWDSDIAKWIEAAAYTLASHADPALERRVDRAIRDIEHSQMEDGYFNSFYQQFAIDQRWTNLRGGHELYCAGHLMEAAVAYWQATGKRRLLDVMVRFADHIDGTFGRKRGQIRGYPGHPEIELGLVRLYEATQEERYLALAEYFVNERGKFSPGTRHHFRRESIACNENQADFNITRLEYNQSYLPIRRQTDVKGHAVRALYLFSGVADVAAHTGDATLLRACKTLWKNLVTRRMAIIGGVGPRQQNEGMTSDYDLPAEGAYLETCAAIALVFWAHRFFLATGDSETIDIMERALYNGTISGVGRHGDAFFYGNPLTVHPRFDGNAIYRHRDFHYRRVPWFGCACCPPNLARMIAQFPGYVYATRGKTLYVNLYTASTSTIELGGIDVGLTQKTDYPWNGDVRITVKPSRGSAWTLALRIPGWTREARVTVNGRRVATKPRKGYVHLKREWKTGDRVELKFPMPVEQIAVNPRARQVSGQVALQRGPIVYCLEEADNGPDLANVYVKENTTFRIGETPASLGRVPCITADARTEDQAAWNGELYVPRARKLVKRSIKAIPYFLWANRKPGEMTVFLKRA